MKKTLFALALFSALHSPFSTLHSQVQWGEIFNRFSLEARGDAMVMVGDDINRLGFQGRYFNLLMGGNLGNGFSYYFRQRIVANPGSVNLFDNTDFLYLNYEVTPNWRLRFGKDAMAIGGFEYDAPPIDEYLTSTYWDNFYCFQMGVSAAYTSDNGCQSFIMQLTQSPYINSEARPWDDGLLALNMEWMGCIGEHVKTLWSTSMIMRDRVHYTPYFMNLTAIGTQLVFDRWNWYFDFLHRAMETDDWGKNFSIVSRFNYQLDGEWTLFAKGSYEQNHSKLGYVATAGSAPVSADNLVPAGHEYAKMGLGCEYRPNQNVRLHLYGAFLHDANDAGKKTTGIAANFGATWNFDVHKLFKN